MRAVCALIRTMDLTSYETSSNSVHSFTTSTTNPLLYLQGTFDFKDAEWKPTPLPAHIAELIFDKVAHPLP